MHKTQKYNHLLAPTVATITTFILSILAARVFIVIIATRNSTRSRFPFIYFALIIVPLFCDGGGASGVRRNDDFI